MRVRLLGVPLVILAVATRREFLRIAAATTGVLAIGGLSGLTLGRAQASVSGPGITKIVPTDGAAPGEPFTIIDSDQGRLVDGAVGLFTKDGTTVEIALRTHSPFKTAQGRLPLDIGGGTYSVSVRKPDATTFSVGTFIVIGGEIRPPFIEPIMGPVGTLFTITDDQARIQDGDIAFFYPNGSPSELGLPANNVEISDGGRKLTGNVPAVADRGTEHAVAVRPDYSSNSRFGDLLFFVQA